MLDFPGRRHAPADPLPPAITPEERAGLLEPPGALTPEAAACWRTWAPKALAERTLTPATEPGFRELCIRMANVAAIDARIAHLGAGTQDSLPYLKERRGQAAQLASALKDYKLMAFGKPSTTEKPAPAANPWGAIGGNPAIRS